MDINKLLNRDKENLVEQAICEKYERYVYVMELDTDKNEAYYSSWDDDRGVSIVNMVKYSINSEGTSATLTSEPTEVVKQSEYKEVNKSVIVKAFESFLNSFGGTDRESAEIEKSVAMIYKQLDDEQMIAYEPLYISPDGVDGHGWTADADVLRSMTESCDRAIREGRLLSKYNHDQVTDDFTFIKAFVAEVDCYIGEHFVPEGQPIIKVQFNNKEAWEKRKVGKLCGVSIGAKGKFEEIEE